MGCRREGDGVVVDSVFSILAAYGWPVYFARPLYFGRPILFGIGL